MIRLLLSLIPCWRLQSPDALSLVGCRLVVASVVRIKPDSFGLAAPAAAFAAHRSVTVRLAHSSLLLGAVTCEAMLQAKLSSETVFEINVWNVSGILRQHADATRCTVTCSTLDFTIIEYLHCALGTSGRAVIKYFVVQFNR